MSNHKDFGIGAAIGSFVAMIPDSVLNLGGKAVIAIVTAFVTGFVYRAGQMLFEKVVKKGRDNNVSKP